MKMKLIGIKVCKKDSITEQQAETRFYALYKPMMEMIKKNIKKIYKVRSELHDTINEKNAEFERMCRSVNISPSASKSPTFDSLLKSDYPKIYALKVEIGRLKNMKDHIDFMIKEIGPAVLSELGTIVSF